MPSRRYLSWLSPTRITLGILGLGYLAILSLSLADRWKQTGYVPADLVWTADEVQKAEAAKLAAADSFHRLSKAKERVQAELNAIQALTPRKEPEPGSPEAFHSVTEGLLRKAQSAGNESGNLARRVRSFLINERESYNSIYERIVALFDSRPEQGEDAEKSLKHAHDESLEALPTLMKEAWPNLPPKEQAERLRIAALILDGEYQDRLRDYYLAEAHVASDKQLKAINAKYLGQESPEKPQ
ncbi:hypothetical protein [Paludisphaera borealis]|uniref:Uncharacterized protein n=1 Tax=Paludisphaera borealis TaxID=1387353 RepID=A0A1U7CTL1_9BACT|nr:hypothetical protein [Paludisphaera borealis]APW62239.1 hypothetical protein BSF38_03775 [Paludisphaera borealis]